MRGLLVEDHLIVRLQKLGCEVLQSEELDHKYKLDFVITRFDGIAKMRPVGIQLTTRPNDYTKMGEFASKQKMFGYVEKALYVELLDDSLDRGVDRLLYAAILMFLFSTEHASAACLGIRIKPGFAVEWFDPASAGMVDLSPAPVPIPIPSGVLESSTGAKLTGFVSAVNTRGYGFIQHEGGTHFFPLSKVIDADLKVELEMKQRIADPWSKGLRIPVSFISLGQVRGTDENPIADLVERLS